MSVRLCITGGIACGKSLVTEFIAGRGVPVIDADEVCHRLMRKGAEVYTAVAREFGSGVLTEDGEIDRRRLAAAAFGDAEKLRLLNSLVHPAAMREIVSWLDATAPRGKAGPPLVAGAVPLLFETGWLEPWDLTLCVVSPPGLQIERLLAKGLTAAEAEARISAQMPQEEKARRSDFVVFNGGTRELLFEQTLMVLDAIMQK